ncbi:ribosome biogenesis GTPase Der [Patescibacteria group bacterium]|nr:ribosome biogenesis GTPase Der [Patescibacteria group bacterium]MBU1015845.1 ribosome biogenesis GTPase Der [Patescibacteria group bacterium]MBU1685406.1 ribosome biogenesis GTPase Der [Patescibacteria group bacterium]MBU1938435.1 ribosome biogenesis GTPase Der [Patescibacteria group bacterium]
MKTPIITIVGRPNVGKSTLFNKIIGSRVAITAEEAGTTRDRLFHKVTHPVIDFFLVDTGGLEFGKGESVIEDDMQTQSRIAMEEGDLILFVVDSKTGVHGQDIKAAELLRSTIRKPVILVVNKCDQILDDAHLAEFYSLGLGQPYQVSAIHKTGIDMLVDYIMISLRERHFITKNDKDYGKITKWESAHTQVAVAGKPNVGKSSLINAILNKEKLIVSAIPGTTRDSTDSFIRHKDKEYNFIDTAGLKRPGKTQRGIERFSALRSMAAIERCDVALMVLDSSQPVSHQDQAIASYIIEAGKGLIILANKWDIPQDDLDRSGQAGKSEKRPENSEEKLRNEYIVKLKRKFPFLSWAPVVFTSAVTKKNMHIIFEQIDLITKERKMRITTAKLNTFMEQLVHEHRPTGKGRTHPRIYYITQPETEPPKFIVFVNKTSAFHFSYVRYIENRLREKFTFTGTPIKIEYREKERL